MSHWLLLKYADFLKFRKSCKTMLFRKHFATVRCCVAQHFYFAFLQHSRLSCQSCCFNQISLVCYRWPQPNFGPKGTKFHSSGGQRYWVLVKRIVISQYRYLRHSESISQMRKRTSSTNYSYHSPIVCSFVNHAIMFLQKAPVAVRCRAVTAVQNFHLTFYSLSLIVQWCCR